MAKNLLELYDEMNAFGRIHNMHYTVLAPGHIEYTFTPGAQHLATLHAAHGGMIAAFMDAVMGVAALSAVYTDNKLVATIEFKLNFVAPAVPGIPLKGIGQVVSKGKSTLVAKGDIIDNQGKTIATGLGTFKAYPYTAL